MGVRPAVWGASHRSGTVGLYGLERKRRVKATRKENTEASASVGSWVRTSAELPVFLLVSLFGMRPTAQPVSINNQPTTIRPSWLQLSKQRKGARSPIGAALTTPNPWQHLRLRKRFQRSLHQNPQRPAQLQSLATAEG